MLALRPSVPGGLFGYFEKKANSHSGSPTVSRNEPLTFLYRQLWQKDNRPSRLSATDKLGRALQGTANDIQSGADFLLRNVLPGSSDAQAAIDAWSYSGAGLNDLQRGDWLNAGGDFSNMALAEIGVLPFIPNLAGMTRAVRELPGIGTLGPASFKALKMETTINPNSLVYRNPNIDQLRALIGRDQWKTVRYAKTSDGNVFVWPAGDAEHNEMLMRLGHDRAVERGMFLMDDDGAMSIFKNPEE